MGREKKQTNFKSETLREKETFPSVPGSLLQALSQSLQLIWEMKRIG